MNNQLEKKNQDTMKKVFKLIRPYMHYLILSLMEADNPVLNAFLVDEEKQVTKEELVIS